MRFTFSKLPRQKNFSYTPKYYDERKEELQEALDRAEARKKGGTDGMKARISQQLKKGSTRTIDRTYRRRRVRHSNYRLLMVIIFLLFLAYIILDVYLPDIFSALGG